MAKEIIYVTSNQGKFEEVKFLIETSEPDIKIVQLDAAIPEIQTLDQKSIAIDKAIKAWEILQKPLLIDDSAIYFEKYNKFPGTLSKFVSLGLKFDGIKRLIDNGDRAYFLLYMVFIDAIDSYKVFEGRCDGSLIKPDKLSGNPNLPFDCLFIPDGADKNYAQMRNTREGNKYFYRLRALRSFLDWYKKR